MGAFNSKKKEANLEGEEVTFDHFPSIKSHWARELLGRCASFQDAEDMFLVVELLVGGDLRYHLQQGVEFGDSSVRLYVLEAASALMYLHERNIIHRDIKPDNLLLDEEGHVHLTDFNIATVVKSGQLATSMSGTRPYMAPEVYECAADECLGYGTAVDWWSLGVAMYEVRRGKRPFDIHSSTPLTDIRRMFQVTPRFSPDVNPGIIQLILGLLVLDPARRVQSLEEVYRVPYVAEVALQDVLSKKTKPAFTPPKDHLNCDPTFELEEMIIESRPLHKKKQRLSKQKSLTHSSQSGNTDVEGEKSQSTPVKTKLGTGHHGSSEVTRSSPHTPPTLTEADLQMTKPAVSPSSVRARIARSPKVKVKGSKVTIESPSSSSSSLTKSGINYLQERLKEIQGEQRRAQSETKTSDVTSIDDVMEIASQSQRKAGKQPASQEAESKLEDSLANHVAGIQIQGTKEEEEEEMCKLIHISPFFRVTH
ncbi:hypothetical protein O3P69_019509 [Scylla paramamosain]|uniref:Protein kinase domain-containing protein n=1 Tax=Scylla paramamosain TaxID=85552 RepID=A0AAW0T029_SCYPA